ncbi:hypothetical protein LLG88_06460, partial [bacterium]|nr:hypothetical protein [bacterium]
MIVARQPPLHVPIVVPCVVPMVVPCVAPIVVPCVVAIVVVIVAAPRTARRSHGWRAAAACENERRRARTDRGAEGVGMPLLPPRFLFLSINKACNLRCGHCSY